jgi:hypothetical protein
MNDRRDLELVLRSGAPIVVIETTDEERLLELLRELAVSESATAYRPLFRWTVTDGLQRLDLELELETQSQTAAPGEILRHIRATRRPGIYALLDFHPFINDPVNVRLLKDIAVAASRSDVTVLLISHELRLPAELRSSSAQFSMSLPGTTERLRMVEACVEAYREEHGANVKIDPKALELLVKNLGGLPRADVERLARNAIHADGAIAANDVPDVMQAKYRLLNRGGVLSYEHNLVREHELAGFQNVKRWLEQRRDAFSGRRPKGLDAPKGMLLIGVQGCGKSLAAKTAATVFGVPLLRLDFGSLYDKYHGETERNLRESLQIAELMGPCVLWLDEIEKGLATGHDDSGTARRVLAAILTWMAERRSNVFLVATANDVDELPPELVRKGRFDEIFFVDLPSSEERIDVLRIHLSKRGLDASSFDLAELTDATEGFSGAEIEQGIVAALYAAHAARKPPTSPLLLDEFRRTRPLSVLMAERVAALRDWAAGRTVPAG